MKDGMKSDDNFTNQIPESSILGREERSPGVHASYSLGIPDRSHVPLDDLPPAIRYTRY